MGVFLFQGEDVPLTEQTVSQVCHTDRCYVLINPAW